MASLPLLDVPGMDRHVLTVDQELRAAVEADDPVMAEMAGHLVLAGGKRIRPLLTCASAATGLGAEVTRDVVLGGIAVELVQVGSLCHDDVIDEALTRRGAESVNARWGNLKAILTGDFLLAKASEIAASLGTEVAGLLAATIGRLCQGEVIELQHVYDTSRTEESYLAAIEGKTAALFATACRIGGIVADLDRSHIDSLTAFGRQYGLAFQVIDDVLDVVATDEQLGKPSGQDLAEGVYNLPVLRALAAPGTGDELRPLLGSPLAGDALERARGIVRHSVAIEDSLAVAESFIESAVAELAPLPDSPARKALAATAHALLDSIP